MNRPACLLVTTILLCAPATAALSHCCHDERLLQVAEQNDLRRGVHGMERGGLGSELGRRDSFGSRGGGERTGSLQDGGFGQMRGDSVGSYGAGSIGERGPGGLGALEGNFIGGQPPRGR